jgi:ribosome-associated translation inhibitor RaiA
MHNPVEITFKGFEPNPRLNNLIQEKLSKIEPFANDITKCHVVMEKLSKHHQKGNAYCVRLSLKLAHFPDIVINEESKEGDLPMSSALRSVFRKAHELVKKQSSRRKQKVARPDKEGLELEDE